MDEQSQHRTNWNQSKHTIKHPVENWIHSASPVEIGMNSYACCRWQRAGGKARGSHSTDRETLEGSLEITPGCYTRRFGSRYRRHGMEWNESSKPTCGFIRQINLSRLSQWLLFPGFPFIFLFVCRETDTTRIHSLLPVRLVNNFFLWKVSCFVIFSMFVEFYWFWVLREMFHY